MQRWKQGAQCSGPGGKDNGGLDHGDGSGGDTENLSLRQF